MSSRFKSGILLVCGVAALNENWWLMQRSCRNEFRRVGAEEEEGESINQMIRLIDSIRLLKWIDRKKSINQMWAGLNWLDSLQLNAHLPAATISHDFIHLFRSIAGKLILIAIQTLNLIGNFPLITHTHTQHNNNIMIYISIDVEYFWDLIGDSLRGSNRIKINGGGRGRGQSCCFRPKEGGGKCPTMTCSSRNRKKAAPKNGEPPRELQLLTGWSTCNRAKKSRRHSKRAPLSYRFLIGPPKITADWFTQRLWIPPITPPRCFKLLQETSQRLVSRNIQNKTNQTKTVWIIIQILGENLCVWRMLSSDWSRLFLGRQINTINPVSD